MKLRHWLLILALFGLGVVIIVNAGQLQSFWRLLIHLKWYVIALIVLVQLVSYWANAKYYQAFFAAFGQKIRLRLLFEAALGVNFVNYILPAAGLAGVGYLTQMLQPDVTRGRTVVAQLVRQAFSALSTLAILPLGFLFLFLADDVDHVLVRIILLLILAIIVAAVVIIWLLDREQLSRRVARRLGRTINRFSRRFTPAAVERLLDEFYASYHPLRRDQRRLIAPFGWSLAYIGIEVLTLYLAYLAFGQWVNPGVVITAYTLANIASLAGGALFSVGVFEATMAATLVALGSPFTLAFSVTVVYRVLNMVIGLPPGLYYYRKYLR